MFRFSVKEEKSFYVGKVKITLLKIRGSWINLMFDDGGTKEVEIYREKDAQKTKQR